MEDAVYLVDYVWNWRKFQKVFRFSFWNVDTNKNVVFFATFQYTNKRELKYRFWFPWRSEKASAEEYMATGIYQKILHHFVAESLQQFVKENRNV